MKSGLEDRNNLYRTQQKPESQQCLNEVRPGRPEQSDDGAASGISHQTVSMKSGLEDRNNEEYVPAPMTALESQ